MVQDRARSSFGKNVNILVRPKYINLGQRVIWVAIPYVISLCTRLGASVAIAWLLAPDLLGLMLLINTLRTGAELLTDVGVGQSIVGNKNGGSPVFYNTAWTIQIIRGIALFFLACAAAGPIARIFDNPQLGTLLPAVAPIFLLTGFTAPSPFLLQKSLDVRRQSLFDLSMSVLGSLIQIALAWAIPNVWALVIGLLLSAACSTVVSYFLMDWRKLRLQWNAESAREIFVYGRWIFASSMLYFLAMNFDRLYFANLISLSALGLYGIARTFSEAILTLSVRFCQLIVFPMISSAERRGSELRQAILPIRFWVLVTVAVALACVVAIADEFIGLIYDLRYQGAGIIMTVLLFAAWFAILAALGDAIMMGIGKPVGVAAANGTKLLLIVIGLPLAATSHGFSACLGVMVFAELFRYMTLMFGKRSAGLGFTRQDLMMTLMFVALAFMLREVTMHLGLTSGLAGWGEQLKALNV